MNDWNLSCRYTDRVTGKSVTTTISFLYLAQGDDQTAARPLLLKRLWPGLQVLCGDLAPQSATNSKNRLRQFWLFLDECQEMVSALNLGGGAITDLEWTDFEAIWRRWIEWLRARKYDAWRIQTTFKFVKNVIETAYQIEKESKGETYAPLELFGYFRGPQGVKVRDSLDIEDGRLIFRALRAEWRASTNRLQKFNGIADKGRIHRNDPSFHSRQKEWYYWSSEANRLHFVRRHFPWGANGMGRSHVKNVTSHLGAYAAPAWKPLLPWAKKFKRINAYLGAVFPTQADLSLAAALVAIKTPLNPSTIGNMSAASWYIPDPQHPERRVIIYGRKGRSGGDYQKAYSSLKGAADPYQVISTVVRLTEPLRQAAKEMAEILKSKRLRTKAEERQLKHLERVSQAIWIYPSAQYGIVDFGSHLGYGCDDEHRVIDRALRGVRSKSGKKCRFRFGDGREMWAQYVYERSGHNLVVAQQTLGHKGLGNLIRYLNSRTIRTRNFVELTKLQKHVFSELNRNRFDPRLLRQLVSQGRIDKSTAHLLAKAPTNRLGLVCSDPTRPDRLADLGHREGEQCREQNCMYCAKWYATGESLPYLQRALLDLEEIEQATPVLLWEGSSYPLWRAFFKTIVDRFSRDNQVRAAEAAKGMPSILLPVRFSSARGKR